MDTYIAIQDDILEKIKKARKNFKKSPKERITTSYLETRLETLEKYWNSYCDTHKIIVTEFDRATYSKSSYFQNDAYDTTEELYTDYKTEIKEALNSFKNTSNVTSLDKTSFNESRSDQPFSVKLPKISIPIFSGKYSEWTTFRDLFTSLIHNNKGLDDVQRLHYLKGYLTGEAEQLLRHIPITASSYNECWNLLENRYNNKKYLANSILHRLLTQKTITTESSKAVKELLDTTNECLNGLKNLNIDISSWDVIVIYIISLKLDTESRKLWEVQISKLTDELPKLSEFKDFLDQRFRSIEFLDNDKGKISSIRTSRVMLATSTISCAFCSGSHKLCNCKKFAKEDIDVRRKFVQNSRLCFNCLSPTHSVYSCRQSTSCRICKRRHHSLLHPKVPEGDHSSSDRLENDADLSVTQSASHGEAENIVTCFASSNQQILLATALIKAESRTGTHFLRSLLDQGSQASFITESAVQLLGLKKIPNMSYISGVGSDQTAKLQSKWVVTLRVQSRFPPYFAVNVKAHVLNKITSILPERKIVVKLFTSQISLRDLADPLFDTPNKVDLLLGADVYGQILMEGVVKGPPGSPVAQKTKLGWILSGCISSRTDNLIRPNTVVSMHAHVTTDDLLKRFWDLEEPSERKRILTEEEQACEDFFEKTITRDHSGRYVVKLPFKNSDPPCQYGNSYEIAKKRFLLLEKRFSRDPELKIKYSDVIEEYLKLGHMEVVPKADLLKSTSVYLPHHAVIRNDKTTTKLRVVFDASCTLNNGSSLNTDMMVGPTLQPELRHILLRWRCHPICLVADIVKMYRQVKVSEDDVDFQRLLWRKDPNSELQHLRLLRVTFGTSSAPYLAVRSLQQLAYDDGQKYPLAADRVLRDFYVDDVMTGCESVEEGIQIFRQLCELLGAGGFELQKWTSNNDSLLKEIKEINNIKENLELKSDSITKILGLTWNRTCDEFQYTVQLPPLETPVTKRRAISDIARLYDPLGWIAPVITTAKIFIQNIWLSGVGWDDAIPTSILNDWLSYRRALIDLTRFHLPRWIQVKSDDVQTELHGFSDASNAAYAAVVYMRTICSDGNVHVNIVASKSKVAPVKQVSIPRLELCGAALLSKLLQEVSEVLRIPKERTHAWTDSSVVLAWLSSHPSRWKTFVANRVSEILMVMDNSQWCHVKSEDNPADLASRGISASDLVDNELWLRGPKWLHETTVHYSKGNFGKVNLEEKKNTVLSHLALAKGDEIISRFSNLTRLLRTISYCKRFANFCKLKSNYKPVHWLTAKEIKASLLTCIRLTQQQTFVEELDSLKRSGRVKKSSRLTSLSPFVDGEDILRVGGRLQNAAVVDTMKHPIILSDKSHLTYLIIADAHERTLHGGPQLMLNYLRTRYWILNAKNSVRHYVRKCVVCIRFAAQTNQQLMGQLPTSRVTACRPFYQSGVDFAGPVALRPTKGRGYHSTKGYICLFICMATRAIHLEVVSDLTSDAFLAAFKRFVARRGHCADLWSDNGTNFVGANRELRHLFNQEKMFVANDIADWLSSNGTEWHFIPPHSPNFGGLWEAGVKSTKYHLKRVIGSSTLTFEEMTTLLCQIEACLNSRPISQASTKVDDPAPLTPGHFLVGEPLMLAPDANFEDSNMSTLKRWHFTQRLLQDFWRRWSQEYLSQLQQRHKWTHIAPEPKLGDIVLVKENDLPPSRWLYGKIVDKHTGSDNLTRVVSLRCKNSVIKRPVSKLIFLPVAT